MEIVVLCICFGFAIVALVAWLEYLDYRNEFKIFEQDAIKMKCFNGKICICRRINEGEFASFSDKMGGLYSDEDIGKGFCFAETVGRKGEPIYWRIIEVIE